jgi:hypothetical protein
MTAGDAQQLARFWVARFHAFAVGGILSHFSEQATFTSPRAQAFTGRSTVCSRATLGEYWRAALASIHSLQFVLDRAIFDPVARTLVIVYDAHLDDRRLRAIEMYEFDVDDRIVRGEAMYGAALP